MAKPCKDCPQGFRLEDIMVDGKVDFTKISLPQIYFAPISNEPPLQQLRHALPPYDGIQRKYQRPVFGPDGSVEYPRLGGDAESPPDLEGYKRDESNPWLFHPQWVECSARYHGVKLLPDGAIEVKMACQNPQSPHNAEKVSCEDCQGCPVRKLFKIGE